LEDAVKLLPKLTLLSIGVAAVPLAIAGYSSIRVSQSALREAIQVHEVLLARQISEYVSSHLGNLRDTMAVETRILDLTRVRGNLPSDEALRKFLHLVYHQSDDFSIVAMLDKNGKPVVPSAFQSAAPRNDSFGAHEIVGSDDSAKLPGLVPVDQTLREGSAVGPILILGEASTPHVVLSVRYEGPGDNGTRVIAAAVSLRRLTNHLASLSTNDRDIILLDREARVVVSGRSVGPPSFEFKHFAHGPEHRLPENWFVAEYESGGHKVIGAFVPAPTFMLGVVVERWLDAALRPARRLGWTTAYWVGVAAFVAALVGAALARSLSSRVGSLLRGSQGIAQGKLDMRLEVSSNDELGELAKSFNAMASSLDAARGEITQQTRQIMGWNESLEKRVEDKTKELREAQDLLLRSRALAAIGSLGAGVAHEINNPLTGVLGLAQLALTDLPKDHPAHAMVQDIEDQALRIQGIVSNLLRFSQRQGGEGFRILNIANILDDALELCGTQNLANAKILVVKHVASASPPVRGNALQLQAAFIQLIQNAVAAMENGGTLTLDTTLPEAKLFRVRISDTGRGIKPEHLSRIFDPFFTTKAQRTDTGIGLSVVHKIIEDHGGTIRVESTLASGTTFWITLPIDLGASTLA
jgi:two-component system NtrC family sensor kinase